MTISVVCWDPSNERKPGELIEGKNAVHTTKHSDVATLPYDPVDPIKPLARSAIAPFTIAHWGQGWLFNRGAGERGCPMVVEVQPERPNFSWAARVVPTGDGPYHAQIRLITNPHPRGMGGGLSQEEYCTALDKLDEHGGVTVYGRSTMNANVGGLLFTDFYCTAKNVKVEWTALSQHKK